MINPMNDGQSDGIDIWKRQTRRDEQIQQQQEKLPIGERRSGHGLQRFDTIFEHLVLQRSDIDDSNNCNHDTHHTVSPFIWASQTTQGQGHNVQ